MTLSIAARCPATGMLGVAVASSSIAVAARCAHARPNVGAVLTQCLTDPRLADRALGLMALGSTACQARAVLVADPAAVAWRQLVLVDGQGGVATFSGALALGVHATAVGDGVAAAGNLLADEAVPAAMVRGFAAADGPLPARLLAAMAAGRDAGGEVDPLHAAGLLVVREVSWPIVDLRVDWSEGDPIAELTALWERYAPDLEAFVVRALDPAAAAV